MSKICLEDPLEAVKVSTRLVTEIESMGYRIEVSSDLNKFTKVKQLTRNEVATPFFDNAVANLSSARVLWMQMISVTGDVSGLQAFRFDYVDTSLTDWAPAYIIGLYMRRHEIMVPTYAPPPSNSIGDKIRGKLIYHGEFWISTTVRNRKAAELFSKLGIVLSLIKWNPDSVWALSSDKMATHGHLNRMGYTHLERGFLRWQWASKQSYLDEWLNIAERQSIEQMVSQIYSTRRDSNSELFIKSE